MGRGAEALACGSLIARQYIEPVLFRRLLSPRGFVGLPSQCAVCRSWASARICEPCRARFAPAVPRCARCALRVPASVEVCGDCLRSPPPFDATWAALDYRFPWDGLIPSLKFHDAIDLAPALAAQLADALRDAPRPELLLPVPLSDERLRQRGYNQSWEVARRLSARLDVPSDARLLLRVKDTPHQLSQALDRRSANVRGAFAVEPLRRAELAGRHVAVIDDVMTTGATCAEIARVLKQAGARRVDVWVLARTPREH